MANIVMAYIVIARIAMAYMAMAYIFMAFIAMANKVMAYIVMAFVVVACKDLHSAASSKHTGAAESGGTNGVGLRGGVNPHSPSDVAFSMPGERSGMP